MKVIIEYKTVYIAKDGKRFGNSKECSEYETELKNGKYAYKMYELHELHDANGVGDGNFMCKEMPLDLSNLRECDAVYIKTIEAARLIDEYCNKNSIISPFSNHCLNPGVFYYKGYEWIDIDNGIKELQRQCNRLIAIKRMEQQNDG